MHKMANLWRGVTFCFTKCIIKKSLVTFVSFSVFCTMVWFLAKFRITSEKKTVLGVNKIKAFDEFLEGESIFGT